MTTTNPDPQAGEALPKAHIQPRERFSFSLIWLVPLIALVLGGWLAYRAVAEKGPVITITFKTADGLEAGKTKVKYKDVDIGLVEDIQLLEDLSGVVLTVQMTRDSRPLLTSKTRFWVVRARVTAGEVSGLGTLFSGAYIGIDPITTAGEADSFIGLEVPPVITTDAPGRMFFLKADKLGSLDIGSPVYYRGIQVGQVVHYAFDESRDAVKIQIFIEKPLCTKVTTASRFWNASGIDITLNTAGVEIDTQSLVSVVQGGVAFDLPKGAVAGEPASENSSFKLYKSHGSINEKTYTRDNYCYLFFNESVRGLSPGSSVEFRGIQVGEVVDIQVELLEKEGKVRIPVLIALEPLKPIYSSHKADPGKRMDVLKKMVKKGLRAQLQTANMLTGQRFVSLDFDDSPRQGKMLAYRNDIPIIPTSLAPMEEYSEKLGSIIKKLDEIPFDRIGADLQKALVSLNKTLVQTEALAVTINEDIAPDLQATLVQARESFQDLKDAYGTDSSVNYRLDEILTKLDKAIRSFHALTDYLDRHPEALISGKKIPDKDEE